MPHFIYFSTNSGTYRREPCDACSGRGYINTFDTFNRLCDFCHGYGGIITRVDFIGRGELGTDINGYTIRYQVFDPLADR